MRQNRQSNNQEEPAMVGYNNKRHILDKHVNNGMSEDLADAWIKRNNKGRKVKPESRGKMARKIPARLKTLEPVGRNGLKTRTLHRHVLKRRINDRN